jgi:hypothetical protein
MTTIQNSTAYWTSTANAVAAANTLTSSTATTTATTESKKKPTWKWSGEDTPFEHRRWDDGEDEEGYDDTYEEGYDDHAFLNEEEEEESDKHQFGLCWSCKKGLDDRADFVCDDRENGGFFFMCTDCYEGYIQPWYHHHHEEKQGADP